MPSSRRVGICAVFAMTITVLGSGCLFDQSRAMKEARAKYDECVRDHPHDAERACAVERAEVDARSERYEADAERAWGCNGQTSDCDPRDRLP